MVFNMLYGDVVYPNFSNIQEIKINKSKCFHSYGYFMRQYEGITLIRAKTVDWSAKSKVRILSTRHKVCFHRHTTEYLGITTEYLEMHSEIIKAFFYKYELISYIFDGSYIIYNYLTKIKYVCIFTWLIVNFLFLGIIFQTLNRLLCKNVFILNYSKNRIG